MTMEPAPNPQHPMPNIMYDQTPPLPFTVRVERHVPDIDNLREQVSNRIETLLFYSAPPPIVYLNPIATVTCDGPTLEFFHNVRMLQAQWCKRALTIFGRHAARKSKNWHSPDSSNTKADRVFSRALCYTGIILWRGQPMLPDMWEELEERQ